MLERLYGAVETGFEFVVQNLLVPDGLKDVLLGIAHVGEELGYEVSYMLHSHIVHVAVCGCVDGSDLLVCRHGLVLGLLEQFH